MNFKVIESHHVDQYDEFLKMYNEGIPNAEIKKTLGIGGPVYLKYYHRARDNEDITIKQKKNGGRIGRR